MLMPEPYPRGFFHLVGLGCGLGAGGLISSGASNGQRGRRTPLPPRCRPLEVWPAGIKGSHEILPQFPWLRSLTVWFWASPVPYLGLSFHTGLCPRADTVHLLPGALASQKNLGAAGVGVRLLVQESCPPTSSPGGGTDSSLWGAGLCLFSL